MPLKSTVQRPQSSMALGVCLALHVGTREVKRMAPALGSVGGPGYALPLRSQATTSVSSI